MKKGFFAPAVLAGLLVVGALGAAAQAPAPGGTEPTRRNPNVPAITGDRQQVPMGSSTRAESPNNTRGSATGLMMEQRPRLREFALKHREIELKIQEDIKIGTVLPDTATLLDIPPEFRIERYRLALANQKTLLVEPSTRRVAEVIE